MTTLVNQALSSFALFEGALPAGYCAYELPIELNKPRGIVSLDHESSFLVLERNTDSVLLLHDTNDDGLADAKKTLVSADDLNHGLAVYDGFIYASSDSTVYRWPYTNADGSSMISTSTVVGDIETVVVNMNDDGNGNTSRGSHVTRTLEFDSQGRLYISVGSIGNIDSNTNRSLIRRIDPAVATFPLDFMTAEIFAKGVRNEVGLAFDKNDILWGVGNSADNLRRDDLGGDITNDNPAEEMHRFREEDAGGDFGYPFCWNEFLLPDGIGQGRGTSWVWPTFLADGSVTDADCRSDAYMQSQLNMQAHSAPLGITFYDYKPMDQLSDACADANSFPESMDGFAFIAYHGSWNRDTPTGYKVVYVPMDADGNVNDNGEGPVDLLAHDGSGAVWVDGFRPVDVAFDACGRLLVTSDGTGQIGSKVVRIDYCGTDAVITSAPTQAPVQDPAEVPTQAPVEAPVEAPAQEPAQSPSDSMPMDAPVTAPTSSSSSKVGRGRRLLYTGVIIGASVVASSISL